MCIGNIAHITKHLSTEAILIIKTFFFTGYSKVFVKVWLIDSNTLIFMENREKYGKYIMCECDPIIYISWIKNVLNAFLTGVLN